MTLETPDAFVQTEIALDRENVNMNIRRQLVDINIEDFPGVYDKYVRYEGGQKILYVQILKALYGMLLSLIIN